MRSHHSHGEKGFIALTSALVMSAVLIILMFTTSESGFYARADAMNGQNKRASLGLAESCTNAALLKVSQDYGYSMTADANYGPISYNTSDTGVKIPVDTGECYITSLVFGTEDPITHRKAVDITTQAKYQNSFSNISTHASLTNPSTSIVLPPPTCVLQATPASIPAGAPITVQWSATSNTTAFAITPSPTPAINNPTEAQSGTGTYTAAGTGAVTYTGTATSPGGSSQCSATVTVTPPPPAPSCADTVMMFDRSGSLSSTDLNNEKTAGNSIIDLYAGVSALPKIAAGSFGGYPNGGSNYASIPTSPNGQLQSTYTTLKSTINTFLGSNSSVGSHLSNAIDAARVELTSVRATAPKKVLIFVSDGEPTDSTSAVLSAADTAKLAGVQIFTVRYSQDTDTAARTLMAQIASGNVTVAGHQKGSQDNSGIATVNSVHSPTATHSPNNWTNGNKGFVSDGVYATETTNGDQQGFSTFGFSIPAGAMIVGIEVLADAKITGIPPAVPTATLYPNGQGTYTAWTNGESVVDETGTPSCSSSDSIITAANNNRESVKIDLSSVPDGSTITSVVVTSYDKADSVAGGTYKTFVRVGATDTDAGSILSSNTTGGSGTCNSAKTQTIDITDFTKNGSTNLEVGVLKAGTTAPSNSNVRIGALRAIVNYIPNATCQISVNLSKNNGGSWSNTDSLTLGPVQAVQTAGTPTDKWGTSWASGDFSNSNFVVRVTNDSCSGGLTANLDGLQAKVYYTSYDTTAENSDGDNFFITPLTAADMSNIFTTIGQKVCPAAAAACANTIDDDGDGFIDTADSACHTDGNASNTASYNPATNDEWSIPPIPPAPPQPTPPPAIDISSWQEQAIQID